MVYRSRLVGFTLIEVIIVLAISSLLMLLLTGGILSRQRRDRMTDAMERIVATLEQVKTEANATLNLVKGQGGGNDPTRIIVGKVIRFQGNQMIISTLTAVKTIDAIPFYLGLQNHSDAGSSRTVDIPWGLEFQDIDTGRDTIVFLRSLDINEQGILKTYILDQDIPGRLLDALFYDYENYRNDQDTEFLFRDPSGLEAEVIVSDPDGIIQLGYLN